MRCQLWKKRWRHWCTTIVDLFRCKIQIRFRVLEALHGKRLNNTNRRKIRMEMCLGCVDVCASRSSHRCRRCRWIEESMITTCIFLAGASHLDIACKHHSSTTENRADLIAMWTFRCARGKFGYGAAARHSIENRRHLFLLHGATPRGQVIARHSTYSIANVSKMIALRVPMCSMVAKCTRVWLSADPNSSFPMDSFLLAVYCDALAVSSSCLAYCLLPTKSILIMADTSGLSFLSARERYCTPGMPITRWNSWIFILGLRCLLGCDGAWTLEYSLRRNAVARRWPT